MPLAQVFYAHGNCDGDTISTVIIVTGRQRNGISLDIPHELPHYAHRDCLIISIHGLHFLIFTFFFFFLPS